MTSKVGAKSMALSDDWNDSPEAHLSPILAAALEAFNEHGYHGASVRDISRRVGVTVPALYYHHENKEAILFALLDQAIIRLSTLCEGVIRSTQDRPVDQFLQLIECITFHMVRSSRLAALDNEIRSLTPEHRAEYAGRRKWVERMVTECIESGQEAGVFDVTSPPATARALLGMLQTIPTWYRPAGTLTPEELVGRYLDICAHTVGASVSVVARARSYDPLGDR